MQFIAPAEHYDRFMGRYVPTLAVALADAAGVAGKMQVLDVGCGPGGLTVELAARVGASRVAGVDPAPQFVAACRERVPGADVREGVAEALPWPDGTFDAALSSLVMHFMADADQGVREMARVTRPGGTVAACAWDMATGGMTMLHLFWQAVGRVRPGAGGEAGRPGTAEGDIAERFGRAGLRDVVGGELTARAEYTGFDDFWDPFAFGVGPASQHLRAFSDEEREAVREALRAELPAGGPFTLDARAWYARGTAP